MNEGAEQHSDQTNTDESDFSFIYEYYKKLDLWTLTEGLCLLIEPPLIHPFEPSFPSFDFETFIAYSSGCEFTLFKRGVESGSLKVHDYEPLNKIDSKPTKKSGSVFEQSWHSWNSSVGRLKINPFEFLEFVKKKEMFEIPPELKFRKNISKSDNVQYSWASDVHEDAFNKKEKNTISLVGLDPRAERTYLNIIGVLLEFITGQFKDEKFSSETELREFIHDTYDDLRGVRERTLAEKFALAKKALRDEI